LVANIPETEASYFRRSCFGRSGGFCKNTKELCSWLTN